MLINHNKKYEIIKTIGKGSSGTIFLAKNRETN